MSECEILIVGAGHGGAQASIALRQRKFDGSIILVGDEPDFPYERPPLSKDYLADDKTFERIQFRPEAFWKDREIELRLGNRVTEVESDSGTVKLQSGEAIQFKKLIWAAGGAPRTLACGGADLAGVHSIRSRADVDRLKRELPDVRRVVVIGGGYIGLEAAAVLRKMGRDIVVLETQNRVLSRVAGEPLSRFFEVEHRSHGVEIRTEASVECIEGRNGAVTGVRLSTGEVIAAELVIVGIGIIPTVEPLARAGATVSNGVHVDEHCRTSLPDIFAIGDCALHQNRFANGAWVRLESVQNANDQAQTVARWLTGEPHPYETVPWFWSNQYDLKLQTVGLSTGFDDLIVRGDPASRSFSLVYLRDGNVIALDCVNDVKSYVQGKALVETRAKVAAESLADSEIPLRQLVA